MGSGGGRDRAARIGFVAYALALAVVLLNPSADLGGNAVTLVRDAAEWAGLPDWLADWHRIEVALNVVGLAPLPMLGMLAWPQTRWQDWTAWFFVVSMLAEGTQALLFSMRTAALVDVVANTAGACLGALSVAIWRRGAARRGRAAPATDLQS